MNDEQVSFDFLLGSHMEWEAFLEKRLNHGTKSVPGQARAWPKGLKGSISHCELTPELTLFVAALSHTHSIGVDLQELISPSITEEVRDLVGSEEEFQLLKPFSAEKAVSLLFSAKEALYKLTYPITQQFLDFREVSLSSVRMKSEDLYLQFEQMSVEVRCQLRSLTLPNLSKKQFIIALAKVIE